MNLMRLADRIRRHFRQADGPDLTCAHHLGQRADALLDWDALVPAVQIIEIDDIRLQASQAVVTGLPARFRPAIDFAFTVRVAEKATKTNKQENTTARFQ